MPQIRQTPAALAGSAAVFPPEEFRARAAALQDRIRREGADALLLTGPENVFWTAGRQTAGYFAFQALLMPAEGEPVLLVRQLEETGARADAWFADIRTWQAGTDPAAALAELVRGQGVQRLAVERERGRPPSVGEDRCHDTKVVADRAQTAHPFGQNSRVDT